VNKNGHIGAHYHQRYEENERIQWEQKNGIGIYEQPPYARGNARQALKRKPVSKESLQR